MSRCVLIKRTNAICLVALDESHAPHISRQVEDDVRTMHRLDAGLPIGEVRHDVLHLAMALIPEVNWFHIDERT